LLTLLTFTLIVYEFMLNSYVNAVTRRIVVAFRATLGHQKGRGYFSSRRFGAFRVYRIPESALFALSRIRFDQVFVEARRKVFMSLIVYTSQNKFPCRVSAFTAAFTVRGRAQRLQKRFTKCGFTNAAPTRCFRDDHKGILSVRHCIYGIFVACNMCTLS